MKIENEEELDNFIICHKCYTVHQEVPISDGSKALCSQCGAVLYRYDSNLAKNGLALSLTALVFFVIANMFPLVKVEILGIEQYLTIPKTFLVLLDNGFFIVGFLAMFLIFVFPLMLILLYTILFFILYLKIAKPLSKELLILISHIEPWSMPEIFLVSILVSLVKLIGYAQIHIGVSFWALIMYVILDLYTTKHIHISEIWMLRNRIYNDRD
jgi:paraquat-inducible protein A